MQPHLHINSCSAYAWELDNSTESSFYCVQSKTIAKIRKANEFVCKKVCKIIMIIQLENICSYNLRLLIWQIY